MNNNNGNNTNIRPIDVTTNNNASPNTNKKPVDFSIRMTLDPSFAKKYAGLSDDIIKSTEVDYKREQYTKRQTRGSKRDAVKPLPKKSNKKKNQTKKSDEEEAEPTDLDIKEREIIEAVKGLKLRINPTPKHANHSPYAPEMTDPSELEIEVERMELSE